MTKHGGAGMTSDAQHAQDAVSSFLSIRVAAGAALAHQIFRRIMPYHKRGCGARGMAADWRGLKRQQNARFGAARAQISKLASALSVGGRQTGG